MTFCNRQLVRNICLDSRNEFALDATFYTFQSEVDDMMGRIAKPIQHIRDLGQERRTRE